MFRKNPFPTNIRYFLGILSFVIFSVSFLIGYDDESADHRLIIVKMILLSVSVLSFLASVPPDPSERIKVQYAVLCTAILIYQMLLLCSVGKTIAGIRYYSAIFSSISLISASLFLLFRFRNSLFSYLKDVIRDQQTFLLILSSVILSAVVIILSADQGRVMFTWDSDTLYGFILELDYRSLYDAKLLTFHSHVSVVYAHCLVLLKLLFRDIRTAFFIFNALCSVAASFGMTFLLRKLVPGKNSISYMLGSAVFMLSPWVCGMATYHIYDYYIWCLFPLLMYFYCSRNVPGFFAAGCMITFSKASGLIVFGSVCLGIVLTDLFSYASGRKDKPDRNLFRRLISDFRYWLYASAAFVFFLFFSFGIPSDTQFEDTRFGFMPSHIIHILKLYMTANFLWLFVILTLILFICVFITGRSDLTETAGRALAVMLISDIVFIFFNCICITYRIPRYMDSHIAVVHICGAVFLISLKRNRLSYILTGAACVLSFSASFRMADPVSLKLFSSFDAGDRIIVDFEDTRHPGPGDSIICNRDYYSYELLLDEALSYAINEKEEDGMIMFSLGDHDNTWGFSGGRYSYSYNENKRFFEEFYDRRINGLANGYLYEYTYSSDMIPFVMRYVFPQETLSDVTAFDDHGSCFYIYMPSLNDGREQEIYEKYQVEDEKEFSFRGWRMNVIRFRNVILSQ